TTKYDDAKVAKPQFEVLREAVPAAFERLSRLCPLWIVEGGNHEIGHDLRVHRGSFRIAEAQAGIDLRTTAALEHRRRRCAVRIHGHLRFPEQDVIWKLIQAST